jgi:hypothetical protein
MNPNLPHHLINIIIKQAELDIDTRMKLRVKPSKIKTDSSNKLFIDKMTEIHDRRAKLWNEYRRFIGYRPLERITSYFIDNDRSINILFVFCKRHSKENVLLQFSIFERIETVTYYRIAHFCAHSGVLCPNEI